MSRAVERACRLPADGNHERWRAQRKEGNAINALWRRTLLERHEPRDAMPRIQTHEGAGDVDTQINERQGFSHGDVAIQYEHAATGFRNEAAMQR